MASKLFHTLVGFGIALGTAVACGGTSSPEGSGDDAGAGSSAQPADAGTDAPPDAFCDASWPTTKGQQGPPLHCVDPLGECAHLGLPPRCATLTGPWLCSLIRHAAFCVEGEWSCEPGGRVPTTECRCWDPLPDDYVCTQDGAMPASGVP